VCVGSGLSSGMTLAAGRVIRERFFFDLDAALEAVGLRE
jgi:hypothetical protein